MIGTVLVWYRSMSGKRFMAIALVALAQGAPAYGLTDPTRPPWFAPADPRPAHAGLQAILRDGPRQLALIDGRLWAVGARVGIDRLVAIRRNSVVLSGPHGTRRLFLGPRGGIKKTAILKEGVS